MSAFLVLTRLLGILNDHLKSLLELNLSKGGKKSPKVKLIVHDAPLANAISDGTGLKCDASEDAQEILRGIRQHAHKLLKGLDANDLVKAQLGLGHSYSRAKLKFNVNRVDNMIIQAIALLDQLDKDVNLFAMRIREWYGYHFPELIKLVSDNYQYARVAQFIGDKDALTEEKLPELTTLVDDNATLAQNILDAARGSMGSSIAEFDMLNISAFATRVVSIADYRKSLVAYLSEKMNQVAPSLTALLGERIGARLISHAGSLTNLSKYPASTVQILGAEKALFRALKTKGNTPKVSETHDLTSHRAYPCAILVRAFVPLVVYRTCRRQTQGPNIAVLGKQVLDCVAHRLLHWYVSSLSLDSFVYGRPGLDNPTPKFGEALRAQVEERLAFFETGAPPTKNAEAIRRVLDNLALDDDDDDDDDEEEGEQEDGDVDMDDAEPKLPLIEPSPPPKKSRHKDKSKDKGKGKEKAKDKDKEAKQQKKRRSSEAMAVDGESDSEEDDEPPVKKVKLSKEEKKALKKAAKAAKKAEKVAVTATEVSPCLVLDRACVVLTVAI